MIRSLLLRILYTAGFFRLWLMLQPKSITIAMLHGVMDKDDPTSQWIPFRSYLSRDNLDATLALLSRYFTFISIDSAMEMLNGQQPMSEDHYCVLTFDDGQLNNLTHAMPILRKHGIPATMYLVTDQIERQEPFWFDRLDYALQQSIGLTDYIDVFGSRIRIDYSSPAALKRTFLAIKDSAYNSDHDMKQISQEILRVTKELEARSGKSLLDIFNSDPWSKVMTWQDVKNASQSKDITFGSHTADHSLLGKISTEEIDFQLKSSKESLEKHIPYSCVHFCYPNGSLHPEAPHYLEKHAYRSAVTTEEGKNKPLNFNKYYLKRCNFPITSNSLMSVARLLGLRI